MAHVVHPGRVFVFGDFHLRADELLLERSGAVVRLTPKALHTLVVLVESAGCVVSKETLFERVWPGTFVVESSLTRNISALRKALDEGGLAEVIETVPKRGYRFRAPVRLEAPERTDSPRSAASGRRRFVIAAGGLILVAATWTLRSSNSGPLRPSSVALRTSLIADHHLDKRTASDVRRALGLFDEAITQDEKLALAHAGRAEAWILLTDIAGESPARAFVEARKSSERAVSLDPNLARAYFSLAWARFRGEWDSRGAEAALQRGLELQPGSALGHERFACMLSVLGREKEAAAEIRAALELDPVTPRTGALAASIWYRLRHYEDAIREARSVLDREPGYSAAHHTLPLASAQLGRYDEAIEQLRLVRTSEVVRNNDLGFVHVQAGRPEIARAMLEGIEREIRAGRLNDDSHLVLDVALGRHDHAIRTLESWALERNPTVLGVIADPRFDVLRPDPRFQAMVRQLRFGGVMTAHDRADAGR